MKTRTIMRTIVLFSILEEVSNLKTRKTDLNSKSVFPSMRVFYDCSKRIFCILQHIAFDFTFRKMPKLAENVCL
jgi:hypothetical protein